MSFSGFGGFGANNNNQQQQNTGFGGFGSNTTNSNTTGGFGTSTSAFGSGTNNNPGGSLFGGSNTSTNTGFGSGTTGGFGQNNQTSAFGSRPAGFGASTSSAGSLFGGGAGGTTTATSGFGTGGFGNNTSNNQTSGGFGSSTGGGLFGQSSNQTSAFGSGSTGGGPGGGLFGAPGTSAGFGSGTTANTGFGSSNPTFGGSQTTQNQGTGGTPFQVHTEKDQGTNQTSNYQSISFQQPYQNFSFEELRNADYNQGRKYGNGSGQAGAFGASNFGSGFGASTTSQTTTGFGNSGSGGGLFGQQQSTTGFGQQNTSNTTTGGFGNSTTGGGLFGAAKPAGGGLFGSTTGTSGQASGGLFGTTSTGSTGGFGQSGTTGFGTGTGTTGGGLFGNTSQTQAPKSLFGGATTGSAFGTGSGGAFGQNQPTGGSIFGNNNNTTTGNQQGSSLFNQQNQSQNSSGFPGFGTNQQQNQGQQGGGLFGNTFGNTQQNQPKPGGLFGPSNTTGGGLFGNQPQQQPAGGLFGNSQQSGGLFGAKPATGGTGLFGNPQPNNGNSLFGGGNQPQQTQGTSLFGQTQNQQPKSLFGGLNNNSTTGGGLFGTQSQNNNQQQGGSSLFGGNQANQSQMGSSLFSNSQQNQQQNQQPQQLTASIMSTTPYGNEHLFAGLGTPQAAVGPVATPLSSGQRARRPAPLPQYKINPAASTRLITPQKQSGYGFSYSTYGTPGSAFSSPSPFGGSLLGSGSLGRSMGRSYSANNLRGAYNSQESIFNPNAFSASPMRQGGSGSLKKLHINRNLRTDLFGDQPAENLRSSPLKKKVSFDDAKAIEDGPDRNGESSTALIRVEDTDSGEPLQDRSNDREPAQRGGSASATPEMEQVRGNELAIVPEEGPPSNTTRSKKLSSMATDREDQHDKLPGAYWTNPPLSQLRKLSREQKKHVKGLVIGRENIGKIEFGTPVDISNVNLANGFEDVVHLTHRSASVYPDHGSKPPTGKGLNVPSTVTLQNSWPRAKGGKLPVHERKGPRFEKHIKRLKEVDGTEFVDYKPETGEWIFRVAHFSTYSLDYAEHDDDDVDSSMLDAVLATNSSPPNMSGPRHSRSVPGAFDADMLIDDMNSDPINDGVMEDPFLDEAVIANVSHGSYVVENFAHAKEDEREETNIDEAEGEGITSFDGAADQPRPKSILKSTQKVTRPAGTPPPPNVGNFDDWASHLQRTVSPKKQDRRVLRESQGALLNGKKSDAVTSEFTKEVNPFATSMDVMNSLFAQTEQSNRKQGVAGKGFQWPYAKRTKSDQGNLIGASRAPVRPSTDAYSNESGIPVALQTVPSTLKRQRELTAIYQEDGVPCARLTNDFDLEDFAALIEGETKAAQHERTTWQLAGVLFKQYKADDDKGNSEQKRRTRLDAFWEDVVQQTSSEHVRRVQTDEEKALAHLSGHQIYSAAELLVKGRNYRLSAMISQIGQAKDARESMVDQIERWRTEGILSEFSSPIRALYELLAGNTCFLEGRGIAGAENKIESFRISERFGFDWYRLFGISLWYGTDPDETIDRAVAIYAQQVYSEIEKVRPSPWFQEQSTRTGQTKTVDQREDILWGLLKLYTVVRQPLSSDSEGLDLGDNLDLNDILAPKNLSPNGDDFRLSFQLYHALVAHEVVEPNGSLESWADSIATELISQIGSPSENLSDAVFIALHLSASGSREQAIRTLLDRHAASLGDDPEACPLFKSLTEELSIPVSWIWAAKAGHAEAIGNAYAQAKYLMRAGSLREAHTVFKQYVAPQAVIEEDFDNLKALLYDFEQAKASQLTDWASGAGVYADYVQLLELPAADLGGKKPNLLKRLASALPSMSGKESPLKERVAVSEMKRMVNKGFEDLDKKANGNHFERSYIPSSENRVLAEAAQMSQEFYTRLAEA